MNPKEVPIIIVNWETYNPKSMQTRMPNWFRIDSKITDSPSLKGFTPMQKWAWICLLVACCRSRSGQSVVINLSWFGHVSGYKRSDRCLKLLHKLASKGLIKLGVDSESTTLQTNKQTYIHRTLKNKEICIENLKKSMIEKLRKIEEKDKTDLGAP